MERLISSLTLKSTILSLMIVLASMSLAQAVMVGDRIPQLNISQWHTDKKLDLSEITGKSVCVIDFNRTWYPPYKFQLLAEAKIQREFGSENIAFLLISNEPNWMIDNFKEQLPQDFVWYAAADPDNRLLESLGVEFDFFNLVHTYIIDKHGRILWADECPDDLENVLRQILSGTWSLARSQKLSDDYRAIKVLGSELDRLTAGQSGGIITVGNRIMALELPQHMEVFRNIYLRKAAEKLFESKALDEKSIKAASRYAKWLYKGGKSTDWRHHQLMANLMIACDSLLQAIRHLKRAAQVTSNQDTRLMLLSRVDEHRHKLAQRVDGSVGTIGIDGFQYQLDDERQEQLPKQKLSSKEAIEDLEEALQNLMKNYAGYDDAEWRLHLNGSGWTDRLAVYYDSMRLKEQFTLEEFFDLLGRFLNPIVDEHFTIKMPSSDGIEYVKTHSFTKRYIPFFTDLRINKVGDRFIVSSISDLNLDLNDLEIRNITTANASTAELNTWYLYPTVPSAPDTEEFLLGMFLEEKPKDEISLRFYSINGKPVLRKLTLHRCKVRYTNAGKGANWSFQSGSKGSLPILRVRTAVEEEISESFWATVDSIKHAKAAILDLRRNLGGSDAVAMNWCGAVYPQEYRMSEGNTIIAGGSGNPRSRWNPLTINTAISLQGPEELTLQDNRYDGRLFVLLDKNVASSGETFAALLRQIPGAVWVGENSRRCVSYGNADITRKLTHSRILLRYGWTLYSWGATFPTREGVGFFPDYWIDSDNPCQVIATLYDMLTQ